MIATTQPIRRGNRAGSDSMSHAHIPITVTQFEGACPVDAAPAPTGIDRHPLDQRSPNQHRDSSRPDEAEAHGGHEPKKLADLLDEIDQEIEGDTKFAVKDVLDAFGSRAFGPLLTVPALLALSPLGAVPGVPSILAVFILLIAGQHMLGMNRPWVPKQILNRSVKAKKWSSARKKIDPWAKRVDSVIQPRLTWLTSGIMDHVISAVAVALALMMIPLELLPFAVIVPGAALLLLGLALSARDGLLALFGLVAASVSGYLVFIALGS